MQGVNYRRFAEIIARRLGLNGYVQNLPDGSVAILCEGEKSKIEEFVVECRKVPPSSVIKSVEVKFEKAKNEFRDFSIRH